MRRNRLVNEQYIALTFLYIPEDPIALLLEHRGRRRSEFKERHKYNHMTYYENDNLADVQQGVRVWASHTLGEYRYKIEMRCIAQNEQSAQIACQELYKEWYKRKDKTVFNITDNRYEEV